MSPPDDRPEVVAYVDGACRPNPGRGGWGVLLVDRKTAALGRFSGTEERCTNQRAEMLAAINALRMLKRPCRVSIYTDSMYLTATANGMWQRRTNLDLWGELDAEAARHEVTWHWEKGHAGTPGNEQAHALAQKALGRPQQTLFWKAS